MATRATNIRFGRGESVVQRSIARTPWSGMPQPTNLMGFRSRVLDRSRRLKSQPTNPPPVGPPAQEIAPLGPRSSISPE